MPQQDIEGPGSRPARFRGVTPWRRRPSPLAAGAGETAPGDECLGLATIAEDGRGITADLLAALDSLGTALIVLDRDDRLIAANRAALAVLEAGDAMTVVDGSMRFLRRADEAAWSRVRSARGAIPAMNLPRSSGKPSYLVLVSRLTRGTTGTEPGLLLRIIDPCTTAPPDAAILEAALGISRAEARVVTELARGSSVREVAVRLGLSHYTVRDHLKRVFRTCDVRTQSQLKLIVGRLGRVAFETRLGSRAAPSFEGVAGRYMLQHDKPRPEVEIPGMTGD